MSVEKWGRIVGKISPLGFTPLLSATSGQVLKYDFRDVGPRVIDKSGHGNGGILKPKWPKNAPRRKIVRAVPPDVRLAFDGEDDYLHIPFSRSLTMGKVWSVELTGKVEDFPSDVGRIPILRQGSGWLLALDSWTRSGRLDFITRYDGEMNRTRGGEMLGEATRITIVYNQEENYQKLIVAGKEFVTSPIESYKREDTAIRIFGDRGAVWSIRNLRIYNRAIA